MENNINERVADLVKSLKMSTNAFAKTINKSQSAVSFIIEGRSKPGFEVLDAICEIHHVNPIWLLRGEGEMFVHSDSHLVVQAAPDQYLQDHVKQLENSFTNLAQQLAVKDRQIDGLQRTVDALLMGKLKDVMQLAGRILSMYPKKEAIA